MKAVNRGMIAASKHNARTAMIDASVRALSKRDLQHMRGALNSSRPQMLAICTECLRIIEVVRANYRKLYAEVYK